MGAASEEPALTLWQGSRTAAWQHHMGYSLRTQAHKTVAATHDEYFIFLHKSTCKVENAAFPFVPPPTPPLSQVLDFNGFVQLNKCLVIKVRMLQDNFKLFTNMQ